MGLFTAIDILRVRLCQNLWDPLCRAAAGGRGGGSVRGRGRGGRGRGRGRIPSTPSNSQSYEFTDISRHASNDSDSDSDSDDGDDNATYDWCEFDTQEGINVAEKNMEKTAVGDGETDKKRPSATSSTDWQQQAVGSPANGLATPNRRPSRGQYLRTPKGQGTKSQLPETMDDRGASGRRLVQHQAVSSERQPSRNTHKQPSTLGLESGGARHVRETSLVAKRKMGLPNQVPHPVPKSGDWLKSRHMVNNYIVLESLGHGSFAEVRKCKEKVSGAIYAMKIISRAKGVGLLKNQTLTDVRKEIAIMKKLNHTNVLRLYEVMDDPKLDKLYLVVEYMEEGDLLESLKPKEAGGQATTLSEQELYFIFQQVGLFDIRTYT